MFQKTNWAKAHQNASLQISFAKRTWFIHVLADFFYSITRASMFKVCAHINISRRDNSWQFSLKRLLLLYVLCTNAYNGRSVGISRLSTCLSIHVSSPELRNEFQLNTIFEAYTESCWTSLILVRIRTIYTLLHMKIKTNFNYAIKMTNSSKISHDTDIITFYSFTEKLFRWNVYLMRCKDNLSPNKIAYQCCSIAL